jgi:uncharacterized cupin superfamily protein
MTKPNALVAAEAPVRPSILPFPAEVAARLGGLERRTLSDPFGLTGVGIYLTRLQPGAVSGPHHRHSRREEFVYVLAGGPSWSATRGRRCCAPACAPGSRRATGTIWRTAAPPSWSIWM